MRMGVLIINIRKLIDLTFYPISWLTKIIIEHYSRKKELEFNREVLKIKTEEARQNRKHELQLKDKENAIRKYETDQKTLRLSMQLQNRKEIAQMKLNTDNPDPITKLIILRKNKKGKKTK